MEISFLIPRISAYLRSFLPYLLRQPEISSEEIKGLFDPLAWEKAKEIWSKIKPRLKSKSELKKAIDDLVSNIDDEDALAALRFQLKKLLIDDKTLSDKLSTIWSELDSIGIVESFNRVAESTRWLDVLDTHDDVLNRIEMIRLLRTGMPPEQIAERFQTDVEYIYRINSAFSLNGTQGLISGSNLRSCLDNLNKDDQVLRRLEMIRLFRSGTPLEVISKEYNAVKDYILRLNDRLSKNGVIGILAENDFQKYRSINPEIIRVCSFNLHGIHDGDSLRFRRIAHELSAFNPDLIAFQEVISGNDVEETSTQIANWLTKITGYHYRTHFAYCHQFMEIYPEGIAVSSKYELKNSKAIDLNRGLRNKLRPSMERYAAVAEIEIYGRRFIFASIHLDHAENKEIRLAQVEKLLSEIKRTYDGNNHSCTILAGDFNDVEDSQALTLLKENGYIDTYRQCHRSGGNTYTTSDPITRIDYIMVKGDVRIKSAELILKNPEYSDHTGLYTVIE